MGVQCHSLLRLPEALQPGTWLLDQRRLCLRRRVRQHNMVRHYQLVHVLFTLHLHVHRVHTLSINNLSRHRLIHRNLTILRTSRPTHLSHLDHRESPMSPLALAPNVGFLRD